ncbi:MAG: hypothetical protein ACYCSA_03395 [Thermoplasmataceae archaeon]
MNGTWYLIHYHHKQIPEPREIGSRLISALSVALPKAIPCSDIKIPSRK